MESKYILYDVLGSLKSMVVNYAFSLNEASSEFLYKEYKKEFDSYSKLVKDLFNYAYEESWYTLESAQQKKINDEIKKLNQELGK